MLQPKHRPDPLMILGGIAVLVVLVVAACTHVDGSDDDTGADPCGLSAVAKPAPPRPARPAAPAWPAAPVKPAAPGARPHVSVSKAPAAPHRSVSKAPTRTLTATPTARHGRPHHHVDVDLDCD
ncbi:hypothetical protein [Streptomyces canus]|uniref:hypothetical protein n=1 Tax=Streptomyces canus TaxID=58343 RepID=UPI002E265B5E